MAHKKQRGAPVPPGNRPPTDPHSKGKSPQIDEAEVSSAQEQDPKRRLGDFEGKGEHSIQEPGGKNDANH